VLAAVGEEATAVFESAREAIVAAVELRARIARVAPGLRETPVPAGVHAAEAEPAPRPYARAPEDVAAALRRRARHGELLATAEAVALAGRIEGLEYRRRGRPYVRGIRRVRIIEVIPAGSPRSTRGR
jgi:hypothetical protein